MTLLQRLWIYQAERFPLKKSVPLLAVFSAASINVSAFLAGRDLPGWGAYATGFILALALFFQMRVADEGKDLDDDRRYRPERAIPRGLVSLRQVQLLGAASGVVALVVALAYGHGVIWLLLLAWAWLGLMTVEFLVPALLKARAVLYLVSHMAIMPLIDLMLTGVEWTAYGAPHPMLWIFLALSFVNGCVLETGRKTWAPESERAGVESYSKLWGPARAAQVFALLVAGSAILLTVLGVTLGMGRVFGLIGLAGAGAAACLAVRFSRDPDRRGQAIIDGAAGIWILICYATAGFLPLVF